jgi:hypothetical protein
VDRVRPGRRVGDGPLEEGDVRLVRALDLVEAVLEPLGEALGVRLDGVLVVKVDRAEEVGGGADDLAASLLLGLHGTGVGLGEGPLVGAGEVADDGLRRLDDPGDVGAGRYEVPGSVASRDEAVQVHAEGLREVVDGEGLLRVGRNEVKNCKAVEVGDRVRVEADEAAAKVGLGIDLEDPGDDRKRLRGCRGGLEGAKDPPGRALEGELARRDEILGGADHVFDAVVDDDGLDAGNAALLRVSFGSR